jgi:hypothetical protein
MSNKRASLLCVNDFKKFYQTKLVCQPSLKFAPNLTYKYQVWLKMIVSEKHDSLFCLNDFKKFYQAKLECLYTSSLVLSLLLASPLSTKFG